MLFTAGRSVFRISESEVLSRARGHYLGIFFVQKKSYVKEYQRILPSPECKLTEYFSEYFHLVTVSLLREKCLLKLTLPEPQLLIKNGTLECSKRDYPSCLIELRKLQGSRMFR